MSDSPQKLDVDVVIPVFNGERYIEEALQSVLAQTLPPRQIVIVDDASTDNTRGVIQQFVRRHQASAPVFKLFRQKKNRGPNACRNAGLKRCQSKLIAFLDADDSWRKDKLKKQIAVFQQTELKNPGVVFCASYHVDEQSNFLPGRARFGLTPSLRGNIYPLLQDANKVSSSASGVLIKRTCFEKAGLFDEQLRGCEDWDMWLRLARHFDFDFVDERLVNIRRHPANNAKDSRKMFMNELMFWDKWKKEIEISPHKLNTLRQLILRQSIKEFPRLGFYREVRRSLSPDLNKRIFKNRTALFLAFWMEIMNIINFRHRRLQKIKDKFRSGIKYLYDKTTY